MIRASGPISVASYMDLCLHDRQHGYYATRPGLGTDFITAPEISQVFGELLGLWLAHEWQHMGEPSSFSLVEIGPGRGTLMTDALRAANSVPGFSDALRLHFIEPSPVLRKRLMTQFKSSDPVFLDQLEQLPTQAPVLVLANEWLDCLPVQQYVRVGEAWHERVIGLDDNSALTFGLSDTPAAFEPDVPDTQTAFEIQPGLKTLTDTLQGILSQTQGRALLIDYGLSSGVPGDTLRSYENGTQISPLAAPGASDLTCDVDFGRLKRLADAADLATYGPMSQSQFLLALGAEARLNQLAKLHPDQADALYAGVKRLVDPAEMGTRFQVLCLSALKTPSPAAF
nr:SAM-dependent methyltransferase [Hyphomonas sp. Mor2]